jgi:hypothetical protein
MEVDGECHYWALDGRRGGGRDEAGAWRMEASVARAGQVLGSLRRSE